MTEVVEILEAISGKSKDDIYNSLLRSMANSLVGMSEDFGRPLTQIGADLNEAVARRVDAGHDTDD